MTQTINLGPEVYVTDPCYSVPTWCQTKLTNVLPGEWICTMIFDELGGSNRNAELFLVHKDYQGKNLSYDWFGDFGVDSGQAGVFDAASYRDDFAAEAITTPQVDFSLPGHDQEGDAWYEKICKFTLVDLGWGSYDSGVVSSSGYGDGMYPVYGAEVDGKVVALQLVFIDQSAEDEPEDDEPDCCNECGAELESDGSCNYCEFLQSKQED